MCVCLCFVCLCGCMCLCVGCDVLCVVVRVCLFLLLLGFVCAFERVLDLRCRCVPLVFYHVMLHALILCIFCVRGVCVWLCEFVNACVLFVIDCGVLTELDFVCVG